MSDGFFSSDSSPDTGRAGNFSRDYPLLAGKVNQFFPYRLMDVRTCVRLPMSNFDRLSITSLVILQEGRKC